MKFDAEAGFNFLIPELAASNIETSLLFWVDLLGFSVAYERQKSSFRFLVRGPVQIILYQRDGGWEPAAMEPPFGRGLNLQMIVDDLEPIFRALGQAAWPLFAEPTDSWYRVDDREVGQREFLVQDPDGYLLRFASRLGVR